MIFQVDFQAGKPVYLQLADQIRYAAASGRLRSGEPLPSLRPLAEELRINRNTIAKAYAELESQGIIETIPGKGFFLKRNGSPLNQQARQKLLLTEIDEDLAQERMRPGGQPLGLRLWLAFLLCLAHWAIAGLDRARFHWSDHVPMALRLAAIIVFASGLSLFVWAMHVNRFFSSVVRMAVASRRLVNAAGICLASARYAST